MSVTASHFSGDVKPRWFGWDKDFFTWHVVGGQAIGPFINTASANSGLGLVSNDGAPGVAAPNTVIKPVPAWGANIGYRHVWTPELRSNVGAGISGRHQQSRCERLQGQHCGRASRHYGCNLNRQVVIAKVNVIWARWRLPISVSSTILGQAHHHRQ